MDQTIDSYQQAVNFYQKGNSYAAELILNELLNSNENDYDVLNFIGVIKLNKYEFKEASEYFVRVILIFEKHPQAQYNLAYCYQQLKENEKAIHHYQKALEYDPSNTDTLINLGLIYFSKKDHEKAENYYKLAFEYNPQDSSVNNNLGNLCLALDRIDEATRHYRNAIRFEPGNSDYYYNLATVLSKQKKYEEAVKNFKKSIELNPLHKEAYNNLGNIYIVLRDFQNAEDCFNRVILLSPDNEEAYYNLGVCFQSSEKLNDAEEAYKQALKINPEKDEAFINIGNVLNRKGEFDLSQDYFNKALKNNANKIAVLTNMGVAKLEQGFVEEALDLFNAVLKLNNDIAEAHYNKSHCLFLLGNLEEGWKEYNWRFKRKEFLKRTFTKPQLTNQDVRDKIILVYDEQGLGDSIHFVRYLKLLKNKGCKIIFECNPRLLYLFKGIEGIDEILLRDSNYAEPKMEYDYQIPLLNIPMIVNTGLNNIPADIPYLNPEPALVEKFEKIIDKNFYNVGLVWGGNPNHTGDKKRSCSLKEFEKLFSIYGVKYYSLQMGNPLNQLKDSGYPVTNLDGIMKDMPDTAAIIQNLDLVISVDTSIAHLAGALNKTVWLLLSFLPDWRWMLNRKDTPWYPSMKLFRQSYVGNWEGVFEEVECEIIKQVETKKRIKVVEKVRKISNNTLYLGLANGENFGWGVCSKYLKEELSKKLKTVNLEDYSNQDKVDGKVLHALTDFKFNSLFKVRGRENIGYTFFENELNQESVSNSKKFDLILAGSSWCKEKMEMAGICNSDTLIQGIDSEMFYPGDKQNNQNLFVVFSGGKFELRKGQDIVLKAIKILQEKYNDVMLINIWYNFWPATMVSMSKSRYINFELKGTDWQEYMLNLYRINNLDEKRIFTLPVTPNEKLRDLYLKTDIGLFPNRCEGGTNLVLMEYMACGKPVIASYNTGHKDILTESNSYPLYTMKDFRLFNENSQLFADWYEPDLDEVVSKLEYAYSHREEIKIIGNKAGEDIRKFTWEKTASDLINKMF